MSVWEVWAVAEGHIVNARCSGSAMSLHTVEFLGYIKVSDDVSLSSTFLSLPMAMFDISYGKLTFALICHRLSLTLA